MDLYSSLVLLTSVLPAVCMIYLAKHFSERRQIVTLLLVIFFAMFASSYIGYYLILIDVLTIDVTTYVLYTSLLYFAVILLIGITILKIRELFLLPAFIATIAIVHHTILDSYRTLILSVIQYSSYISSGQFIGENWYVILNIYDPSFLQNLPYFETIKPFLDPLSVIIPAEEIMVMGIYIMIISAPTIILFYYIAWKNRSGRSLGFALGLTLLEFNMAYWIPVEIHAIITIIGTGLFALGIFGIIDRAMRKKEPQKIVTKIQKTKT